MHWLCNWKRCQREFVGPYFHLTAVSTVSSWRLWHGEDSVFLRQWLFFIHPSVAGREAHPDGCWENKYCLWQNPPSCFSEAAFHPVLFQPSSLHCKSPLALFILAAIPTTFPNALPSLMEWWFCEADKHLPEKLAGTAELIFKCEHGCVESNSSLTRHDAWGHDRISVVIVTEINPSGREDTAPLRLLVCDLPGLRSSASSRREQHIVSTVLLSSRRHCPAWYVGDVAWKSQLLIIVRLLFTAEQNYPTTLTYPVGFHN